MLTKLIFGTASLIQRSPIRSRLVVNKTSPKDRKGHRGSSRKDVHPGMSSYKKYERRNSDPWLLYTSPVNDVLTSVT